MKKTLIKIFLFIILNIGSVYGQETPKATIQKLELYVLANTGNVNPDALPLLAINFTKFGMLYSQNFVSAPWLTSYIMLELKTDLSFNYLENDPTIPGSVHMWNLDEYLIEGGLKFGQYFTIGFNNLGRFDLELAYALRLPQKQVLRFSTELEVLAFGGLLSDEAIKPKPPIPFDPVARPHFRHVVNYFGLSLTYNVVFATGWSFLSQLNPRFTGDDAEAFKKFLQLRWNNGITYTSSNGYKLTAVLRYQGHRLDTQDPLHNVLFIGGISKTFDFTQ